MRKEAWKPYIFFVIAAEVVGALSGFLTKKGVKIYEISANKPTLTPPGVVFPIVWTILYALMGLSVGRIWKSAPSTVRSYSIALFVAQLIVNFFWSLLFFNAKMYGVALIWLLLLWVLVLLMIFSFFKINRKAAYLQIPYLLWITFAAYLNFMVWQLN